MRKRRLTAHQRATIHWMETHEKVEVAPAVRGVGPARYAFLPLATMGDQNDD